VPLYTRTNLEQQLDELIFLLRHYEYIGPDLVWRHATAATTTIYRDAHIASADPKAQTLLGKLTGALLAVVAVISATDSTLGHVESIADRTIKIAGHLKAGYEMVERWRHPQIEYRPKLDSDSGAI